MHNYDKYRGFCIAKAAVLLFFYNLRTFKIQ